MGLPEFVDWIAFQSIISNQMTLEVQ